MKCQKFVATIVPAPAIKVIRLKGVNHIKAILQMPYFGAFNF
jgi:hypothetical protein